jgi:hypothetical protein
MSTNYIINFVDKDGNNFDTVSGRLAKRLMSYSQLLRTLHEIEPLETTFTIPIDMPYGRLETFKKLIKGYPVVEYRLVNGKEVMWYKPLSDEEEAIIANEESKGTLKGTVQEERERVIFDVLSFLMIDPRVEHIFITYEDKTSPENKEFIRRRTVTQKRRDNIYKTLTPMLYHNTNEYAVERQVNARAMPFLNEDKIDEIVEKHKDYLYGVYRPRYYSTVRIDKLLNKKDIEERNKKLKAFNNARVKKPTRRRKYSNNSNNFYNRSNNNNNNNDRLYDPQEIFNTYLEPFSSIDIRSMPSREFERYLRSLRREGEEKYLPNQGPLVGNLFGNTNNL